MEDANVSASDTVSNDIQKLRQRVFREIGWGISMHRYTVTNLEKNGESVTVYWRIGLAASFLATLANFGLHKLSALELKIGLASIPISTAAIYLALAKIVGSHLWRYRWSRIALSISTPILSGDWSAVVRSRYRGVPLSVTGTFTIAQSWRTISIALSTDNANSHSSSSAIIVANNSARLEYQYRADRSFFEDDFHDHRGAASIIFPFSETQPKRARSHELTLSYFTSHGEYGVIILTPLPPA